MRNEEIVDELAIIVASEAFQVRLRIEEVRAEPFKTAQRRMIYAVRNRAKTIVDMAKTSGYSPKRIRACFLNGNEKGFFWASEKGVIGDTPTFRVCNYDRTKGRTI